MHPFHRCEQNAVDVISNQSDNNWTQSMFSRTLWPDILSKPAPINVDWGCRSDGLGADQMIRGGLWFFSPVQTFFFCAPNQKQTCFPLKLKEQANLPHIIPTVLPSFANKLFCFTGLLNKQFFFTSLYWTLFSSKNTIAPARTILSAPLVSWGNSLSLLRRCGWL